MTNTPRLTPYEKTFVKSTRTDEVRSSQQNIPPGGTRREEFQRNNDSIPIIPGDTILIFESNHPGESSGKPLGKD